MMEATSGLLAITSSRSDDSSKMMWAAIDLEPFDSQHVILAWRTNKSIQEPHW